jgi:hypothetical protein
VLVEVTEGVISAVHDGVIVKVTEFVNVGVNVLV